MNFAFCDYAEAPAALAYGHVNLKPRPARVPAFLSGKKFLLWFSATGLVSSPNTSES